MTEEKMKLEIEKAAELLALAQPDDDLSKENYAQWRRWRDEWLDRNHPGTWRIGINSGAFDA